MNGKTVQIRKATMSDVPNILKLIRQRLRYNLEFAERDYETYLSGHKLTDDEMVLVALKGEDQIILSKRLRG